MTSLPVQPFIKIHSEGLGELLDLLRLKKLQPKDMAVLITMATVMEPNSNRTYIRARKIAELLNTNINTTHASIKRLREHFLIVKTTDKELGNTFNLVSPYIFTNCRPDKRPNRIAEYNQAIKGSRQSE